MERPIVPNPCDILILNNREREILLFIYIERELHITFSTRRKKSRVEFIGVDKSPFMGIFDD